MQSVVQADPAALPWQSRRRLLLEEVVAAGAHIVCLQARPNSIGSLLQYHAVHMRH